ncbi:MAG: hypothetical protein QNJ22_00580 [Desulfosarcinaceae bacterium]|nr:hypothetical protein [Desulfosarcinaceae bacterium]
MDDELLEALNIELPVTTSAALRGRQSVRATFKLSGRAIEALSVAAMQLGIKQKSLFDHLMEDFDSLRQIARQYDSDHFTGLSRVQKTYVLSRRTLYSLEEVSRSFQAPRDALVEYSIQRLLPLIAQEREKHEKRKAIEERYSAYLKEGLRLLREARRQLGDEDPVVQELNTAMTHGAVAQNSLRDFIERGKCLEEF